MNEVEQFLLFISELRNEEHIFLSVDIYHDDIQKKFVVKIQDKSHNKIHHFRRNKLKDSIGDSFVFIIDEYSNLMYSKKK